MTLTSNNYKVTDINTLIFIYLQHFLLFYCNYKSDNIDTV
ncbi:hypothetical protein HMPREF0454_00543 [Hafnia alvei ATCC 51873]|uniref:Uncharacterized protein n=1 Tax=Hafnia alvei ATCC 51873 TaxID=1002364 RepID=G9Y2Q5_HAFAL|nr:hypothetical protein HMPREF0454_00543 [Hafnia alvei ATCC 51873]